MRVYTAGELYVEGAIIYIYIYTVDLNLEDEFNAIQLKMQLIIEDESATRELQVENC
jgi:hypothetical protein